MELEYEMNIAPNIRDLIQAKTCEPIICSLMNESHCIFRSKYEHISDQSHSECDIIDIASGQKYDVKVLFSEEQCWLLANGNGIENLLRWYESVRKELAEASSIMMTKKWVEIIADIKNTVLFREILRRLQSVKDDENAILFIPFPIVPASEKSTYIQFASDIVSVTYDSIVNESPDKFDGKHTYIIYPSVIDQKIVLRDLTSWSKEYLPIDMLSPYITFTLREDPDLQ